MKHGDGSAVICAALSWYSAGPIITLHGRIIASNYVGILGQQVHLIVQVYPNNDVIFQDDDSSIHTARSFPSRCEVREDVL